jgi:hypothetical protein
LTHTDFIGRRLRTELQKPNKVKHHFVTSKLAVRIAANFNIEELLSQIKALKNERNDVDRENS